MHAAEFPLLSVGQFRLLAAQFPLGAGDGHALAGAHADEIGFELGEGGEDIEEQLSHRIARVGRGSSRSCRSVEQRAYPMSVAVMGEVYG